MKDSSDPYQEDHERNEEYKRQERIEELKCLIVMWEDEVDEFWFDDSAREQRIQEIEDWKSELSLLESNLIKKFF